MAYHNPIASLAVKLYFVGSVSVENTKKVLMKIQQIFLGIIVGYRRPRDFKKSRLFTLLLARNADCKMLFAKGHQISSVPPKQLMHARKYLVNVGGATPPNPVSSGKI